MQLCVVHIDESEAVEQPDAVGRLSLRPKSMLDATKRRTTIMANNKLRNNLVMMNLQKLRNSLLLSKFLWARMHSSKNISKEVYTVKTKFS